MRSLKMWILKRLNKRSNEYEGRCIPIKGLNECEGRCEETSVTLTCHYMTAWQAATSALETRSCIKRICADPRSNLCWLHPQKTYIIISWSILINLIDPPPWQNKRWLTLTLRFFAEGRTQSKAQLKVSPQALSFHQHCLKRSQNMTLSRGWMRVLGHFCICKCLVDWKSRQRGTDECLKHLIQN